MVWYRQLVHSSRCPPSAAVRQRRIALSTFTCVELEFPKFFGAQLVRRLMEVSSKIAHRANVAANSLRREVTPLEFIQHALS